MLVRVLCIYCGWNDRQYGGAWSMMFSLQFIVFGGAYCFQQSSKHYELISSWALTAKIDTSAVFAERYRAWLAIERANLMSGGSSIQMLLTRALHLWSRFWSCCTGCCVDSVRYQSESMGHSALSWLRTLGTHERDLINRATQLRDEWIMVHTHKILETTPEADPDADPDDEVKTVKQLVRRVWWKMLCHNLRMMAHSYKVALTMIGLMLLVACVCLAVTETDSGLAELTTHRTIVFLSSDFLPGKTMFFAVVVVVMMMLLSVLFVEVQAIRLHLTQIDTISRERVAHVLTNKLTGGTCMQPITKGGCAAEATATPKVAVSVAALVALSDSVDSVAGYRG